MNTNYFAAKVLKERDLLETYAMSLTKKQNDSADLVQDTIYRALANEDKFREGTNLRGWLVTIMKNIFINNYRKKSKRNTIFDNTDNHYFLNYKASKQPNTAEVNLLMEHVNRAVRVLNPDFKVPFMMYFNGFKYQEIAEKMELPLGTIKSRIYFARKALKTDLAQYDIVSSSFA